MNNYYKYLCRVLFFMMILLYCCSDNGMDFGDGFNFLGPIPDTSEANYDIYIMDVDGTNQIKKYVSNEENSDPIFSIDGSKILFGYYELILINVVGNDITDLGGDGNSHQFSPDGSKIIYIFNHESIYMMYMNDSISRYSNHMELTKDMSGPSVPGIRPYAPRFSPDGSKIFFVLYESSEEYTDIWVMDADGSNRSNITKGILGKIKWRDIKLNISPDGTKIVFDIYPHYWSGPDATQADIYTIDINGNNCTKLTDKGFDPQFSPDGSKIVFVSERNGNSEIYIMNTDGSNQVNLTNNPSEDWNPQFSSDGSKILFVSQREGNEEIYTMSADGNNQTNLTNNEARDFSPHFSADGLKIVFLREEAN